MDAATKKRLLDSVATKLKKKIGEDVLVDTSSKKAYQVISTGSKLLNNDLGIGGIPLGRVTEIFGPESSGKCLTGDALISTEQGLLTIEEIFKANDVEIVDVPVDQDDITIPKCIKLVNREGELEETTHFTINGRKPVYEITTKSGHSIRATANHPFLVLSANYNKVWKDLRDLKKGDILIAQTSQKDLLGNQSEDHLEVYELLGYLTARGLLKDDGLQLCTGDSEITIRVKALLMSQFGSDLPSKDDVEAFLELYGIDPTHLGTKVPTGVRKGSKRQIGAFLQGLLETGAKQTASTIRMYNDSEQLLREVKLLLWTVFGISSSLTPHVSIVHGHIESKTYRLNLSAYDTIQFFKSVGFKFKDMPPPDILYRYPAPHVIPNGRSLLEDYLASFPEPKKLRIPTHEPDLTYRDFRGIIDRLLKDEGVDETGQLEGDKRILEKLEELFQLDTILDPIDNITAVGVEPTFDFVMAKTHSFVANGLVVHNTSIATSVMVQAQKAYPDRLVLMVDTEQAFDIEYAKSFGLDASPNKFLLLQPDSAEQAVTILEEYIDTGLISVAVWDSIGGTLTDSQIEKGIDELTMGALAKVLSVGLGKLKGSCKKANTALFCINQIYDKMSYGGGTETKGGRALKFLSSIRISINKRDIVAGDDSDDVVGQGLSWTIRKNKCATPYKKGETLLYFGQGFDPYSEVVDVAIANGIIERGGAWFNFKTRDKKTLKFQGKYNVINHLKGDDDTFKYLSEQVDALSKDEDK